MSGQNSSIHPFIWCITIKPVALCIIRNTWSVTALRSLHTIVSEEGDHQACEKEEILKKIMDKIEVLTDVPLFTKSWIRRFGESYHPTYQECLTSTNQVIAMSVHPFIWCITIKHVALCIIEHTWSLETLRSLHSMVSTYGNHRACEKEGILKKITEKIEESRKLSDIIFNSHNDGWYDFPDQACHLCQAYPGHNVDHYSIHLTSNDRQEPRSELLGYGYLDCRECDEQRDKMMYDPGFPPWFLWFRFRLRVSAQPCQMVLLCFILMFQYFSRMISHTEH